MTRSRLARFLFGDSNQEYLVTDFNYDRHQKSIKVTFTSLDEQDKRSVQFDEVTNFVEETYEDFDGSTEWTIIGLDTSLMKDDTWKVTLQCLEKGFFFNARWPRVISTTACS